MGSEFRVAILGAGNIAGQMAKALQGISDEVVLYAVASRSMEKAEAFCEKWGFEKAYGTYEELAKDDKVDLIYVATPHSEHYSNAKLCIENGRNCLVEKAFCGNVKQAKQLIALAEEKRVYLAEAMWTRYLPVKDVIRSYIEQGTIGKIHAIESDFSVPIQGVDRLTNPALAGGALLDLGVYSLTVPAMYYGTMVKSVRIDSVLTQTGVDATDVITLTYPDGTMCKAKCSAVDENSNYAKLIGDKGYLEFAPINVPEYVKIFQPDGTLVEQKEIQYMVNGYEYEVLESKRMILQGKKQADSMPWEETIRLMAWMDWIRARIGVHYPFEKEADIAHGDPYVWGCKDVYDDSNPWDRSNTTSYLEIYDTVSDTRQVLAEVDGVIEAPNWSHDGTFLTYNADGLVYQFDLMTKTSTQIPSGSLSKMNNDHVLSSDDAYIAVSDESDSSGESKIHIISIKDGKTTLVTKQAPSYLHGWSNDDTYMCYCAKRSGEYDVYEMKVGEETEKRLTTAPGLNDGPEYDVDGEYIYFNSVRCGLMQAFRMKRDGSEQTQLTFDDDLNTWFPHISPDKSKIVMVSYKKGDLWPGDHVPNKEVLLRMMDADGKNLRTVAEIFGGQGTINVNSWSPDSKKFAFVSYKKD